MSYNTVYGVFGTVVGSTLGGQLQQSQPSYTQQQLAQAQQQACLAQLQRAQSTLGSSLSQYWSSKSVFVPLTQDEVDMAEAMYEVNKIAPGLREEN